MQSFSIAPAGLKSAWLVLMILIPIVSLLLFTLIGSRAARFEVSPEGLRLRGDFYGRLIPADQLQTQAARRVDFTATPALLPKWRTMGTGLPGYQAGWFRLQNGEKALLYLTDKSRAVYIPTTAGYSLLLSPIAPDEFLSALRSTVGQR
ncbi:MAG: PH domain-containing protein [Terriglobia bacterium]